jgi:Ca2+-binding RTX toxin-like protein
MNKMNMLTVQGVVIAALLMSLVLLVPAATITPQAAFATTAIPSAICEGEAATITGTAGDDNLVGTPNRDIIAGLGGNDRVQGLDGNDIICGGDGTDALLGGADDDFLNGSDDNDFLNGGTGTDSGDGGPGFNSCVNLETETNCQA